MTETTTVAGSTPPPISRPPRRRPLPAIPSSSEPARPLPAVPSSPPGVPSTKRPPPPPPPPSPRPHRTPTPVQQSQSDSQPQLRPKLSISTPVTLKDADDAQSSVAPEAPDSPSSSPNRPERSSLRISVAPRESMILALPPGADEPMPHPYWLENGGDRTEGPTGHAAFLSPNGPASAPLTPMSPADSHPGWLAATPTTPRTPLQRPAPVRLSSSGPGSTRSGRARRKPVPSMVSVTGDEFGRRLDYAESQGHSDYTTLPSQSAHTDSLSRSDHWDTLPSDEPLSADGLPMRRASLQNKQARRHTLSSGRAAEEVGWGRSNMGMPDTDDDEDLLPPRRLGRGRPSVSSIAALSMVSDAPSAAPSLPSSPAVQQRGYVLEVDLPPTRLSPSPPLLTPITGSRSSTFESLPNSSNPNLLAPRPRANTLSAYSIKSMRSGTASTYEPYRTRRQPPLEAIADSSDPNDPRRPLTPRTASQLNVSAASEKASYPRSSTQCDSTPETTAQRLWKWGFLFPPLWVVGMCISCTPFKATLPSETKNRHELLKILQRTERRYARRCALSFAIFATAVVVIVVTVVGTQNTRG